MVTGEHGEMLVEQHEVGTFVELGQLPERLLELEGEAQRRRVSVRRGASRIDVSTASGITFPIPVITPTAPQ